MIRWLELAEDEDLRSGLEIAARRISSSAPRAAPAREILRLLEAAISVPSLAVRPEWLFSSGLLGGAVRDRIPRRAWRRLFAKLVDRFASADPAEVSSSRFFELTTKLAEIADADERLLEVRCRRHVRDRLQSMSAVEQTEYLLDLPAELSFAPQWPAFRLRLLVDALDGQVAPVVLRAPGLITPGEAPDLPLGAVEKLVSCLMASGFDREAVPWAEHAVRRSGSVRHFRMWGRALLGAGEGERAYAVLARAIDRHPENGPLRMDWAKIAARLGRHAEIVTRGGDRGIDRRTLAGNLAAVALGPKRRGGVEIGEDADPPTLETLRRRLGIDHLVRGLDVAAFREALGLKPIGDEAGDQAAAVTRWLMLGYETYNIGDEIQGIAAARFLPRIDGVLNRDDLMAAGSGGHARAILNGWYMEPDLDGRYRWPPSPEIDGLWVSVHIDPVHAPGLLSEAGIEYLRSTGGPIGCRDRFTRDLLRASGVEAEFTGCMTLTLPRIDRERGRAVCFTDLGGEVEAALAPVVERELGVEPTRVAHLIGRGSLRDSYQTRVEAAVELLAVYASASLVVTSRLHAAVPCYAMGTPVVMICKDPEDLRFGGLLKQIPTLSPGECVRDPRRALELARRPQVLPGWAEKLATRVRKFVSRPD